MNKGFYRAFEDKFRGSRELIKSRLQVYLPFVTPLKTIYPDASAIDLGCGRGEWLEILNTHGFSSQGIDLDDDMLSSCRERHLDVQTAEAVSFLKQLPDESHTIVSAFHLVEHIPFDDLQELVKESLRVLKPAGILILETPNPENITVGTSSFYLDPTHLRPIPPELLSFIPEYIGFETIKILRLQEPPESHGSTPLSLYAVFNSTSPDYAVIAQKKGEAELIKLSKKAFANEYGITLQHLAATYDLQLQKIGELASRANKTAELTETTLNNILNSYSWRITAPLRWVKNQVKLVSQQGFVSRIKALIKKIFRPLVRHRTSLINSHPRFRYSLIIFSKKTGVYHLLRSIYLRLSGRSSRIYFSSKRRCNSLTPCNIGDLTPHARKIHNKLKRTIGHSQKGNE